MTQRHADPQPTSAAPSPGRSGVDPAGRADSARDPHHARRWLVLLVVAVAQLMVVLDATIVNIALPSAQRALGFADTDRQWVVTAYALTFGSLLLLGGKLGDLFGRRTAFLTGLVGFAGASALGGAAQSFGVLVAARALQGVFGALLAPAALATLATTFTDPKERSKAFGIFGAVAGGGSAVGLVLGGLLTEYLDWRYCLYVNLVFAVAAFAGAWVLLTNARALQRPRLDVPGTLLASAGLFCLVFGFSHASTAGWGDGLTMASIVAGLVLLLAFVLLEQRVEQPLLPLRVVLNRVRGGAYLAVGVSAVAIFGVFLFLTYYLQQVKGFSPIVSGLSFLPLTVGIVTASTTSNIVLLPRTGPRPLATTGMLFSAVGMFLLARLTPTSGYAGHVLPSLIVLGLGFGLIFAPAINSVTYGVVGRDAGVASAMVNTMQQVGGSVGTALLSTVAASSTRSYARDHTGAGVPLRAAVHGFTTAFTVSALIFAVGAVVIGLLLPSGVLGSHGAPSAGPAGARPSGAGAAEGAADQGPQAASPGSTVLAPRPTAPPAAPAPPRRVGGAASTDGAGTRPTRSAATDSASAALAGGGRPAATGQTARAADRLPAARPQPAAPSGPPWTVWGRVSAPEGTRLDEAVLTLTDPTGQQLDRTRADASGDYQLVPPSAGTFLLICVSPDCRPSVSTVAVAGTHVRLDLTLVGAGRLAGQVRSTQHDVAGARVTLMDDRGEIVGATSTDESGSYRLRDVEPGEYTLTVAAERHRPEVSSVRLPGAGLVRIDVDLVASGEVTGVVRAASDGRVLAEQLVTLVDGEGTVVARGVTDEQGRYAFADVVEGTYTVTASGFAPVATLLDVGGGDQRVADLALGWGAHPVADVAPGSASTSPAGGSSEAH